MTGSVTTIGTSIGLDLGSTNVKAVLMARDGTTVAAASRGVTWQQAGSIAELDAEALWETTRRAVLDLADSAGEAGLGSVEAIGLCAQYSSIVPVDGSARPLAPMRLYLDQRGTAHCLDVLQRHEEAFATWLERHPIPPVGGGLALGHVLSFQLDDPDVHAATVAYLEPVDYLAARLTGLIAATQVSAFAGQLVDNRCLGRRTYDPDLVALAGVDASRLPPLIGSDEVVGEVLDAVAGPLGLPAGVAVVAGMTDTHANALAAGVGAEAPGRVGIAIGTTAVMLAAVDHPGADLDHEVLTMPGVRAGEYLVWAENGVAGRAVAHVLERFVHAGDALGDHRVEDPFVGFEDALATSPPGAGGVRFLPWLSGSLAPRADRSMRGGFVGVSLDTTRTDLVRAAAEGVAHNLRWLLGPVEAFTGTPATEIVLLGGAARSRAWTGIVADVLGLPVRTIVEPGHAGARAVAVWAARAVGADVDGAGAGAGAGGGGGGAGARPAGSLGRHGARCGPRTVPRLLRGPPPAPARSPRTAADLNFTAIAGSRPRVAVKFGVALLRRTLGPWA